MDEKISHKAVEQYSAAFATKATDTFYARKAKITGPDILALCEVKQVNLFAIKTLMGLWSEEIQKLRSPYFDYQSTDVQEALAEFQNVLSNHISISRENFLPILRKAVEQTLFLILDPYDFYSDTLDKSGKEMIRVEELKATVKYLKINQQPLEHLLIKLEEKKLQVIPGNEAFALLDHILEEVNFSPEDVEPYLAKLAGTVPVTIDKLYEPRVEMKPAKIKASADHDEKQVATIADNFQKITSIKDSLTINQKFMFTKMLFSGDFDLFSQAIEQLDRFESLQQAQRFLELNYSEWDTESEEYAEFVELLEKRYS